MTDLFPGYLQMRDDCEACEDERDVALWLLAELRWFISQSDALKFEMLRAGVEEIDALRWLLEELRFKSDIRRSYAYYEEMEKNR